ncbi:hypothetical protein C9374_010072 [Naegleria lovaniensis]|uniref:Uncharacterized protein n=1 Tax=Naegleria lovaniensis TaxID=51637 RepID=A0AA88GH40_NAELO|nr:uncharacterized protein C9374_010072 [Naegleria lovaniensis]KAG2375068.1 hypothetical protein C9374_010072 [Naegleria lovaniensis]
MNRSAAFKTVLGNLKKSSATTSTAMAQQQKSNILVLRFTSAQHQQRFLQSLAKRNNPGFFDVASGMYESDKYKLDNKPFEFRNGEPFFLFYYLGSVIISIPATMACVLSAIFFLWYSFFDTQVTRSRSNPHPFLETKNGAQAQASLIPLLRGTMKFGILNADYKQLYWNELNRAKKHEL